MFFRCRCRRKSGAVQLSNHPMDSFWVEALQASVRPVITYAFFLVFVVVKALALVTLLQADGITLAAVTAGHLG